jgi:hypothetical protein
MKATSASRGGGQAGGWGGQPADAGGPRFAAGDVEGCLGWVGGGHLQAACGQQAGQGPGAAADVEDAAGAELAGHGQVGLQVGTVVVHGVVDLGQPGFGENGVRHAAVLRLGLGYWPGNTAIDAVKVCR